MSEDAVFSSGREPNDGFELAVQSDSASQLLRVAGEIDMSAAERWNSLVAEMLANKPDSITVDLGGVTFMDSTGLRLLMQLREICLGSTIILAIINIPESTRRVMVIAGIAEYLQA